jgi:hypothetical protein
LDFDDAPVDRSGVSVSVSSSSVQVTTTGIPGTTLVLQGSTDLKTWVDLPPVKVGDNGSAVLSQPLSVGHRFFRVK